MKRLYFSLILLLVVAAGCSPSNSRFSSKFLVTASEAKVYKKVTTLSDVITTFKYKDKVSGLDERYRFGIPKEWIKVKLSDGGEGYVQMRDVSDKDRIKRMDGLIDEAKGMQAQAAGVTSKKTPIRLGPGRNEELLEVARKPLKIEVFDKIRSEYKKGSQVRNETWYRVRLEDGRVGFVHSYNIKLVPPADIGMYTESRKAVAWHMLREKEDQETGNKGRDYIVAYAGTALSPGADFDRIEIYNFDPGSGKYSTSFAKSKLKGMLPLDVLDNGGGSKLIRVRQMAKSDQGSYLVEEYSFPQPIKQVKKYEEKAPGSSE